MGPIIRYVIKYVDPPVEEYLEFDDPEGYSELRGMFIQGSLGTGGYKSLGALMARAMSCYQIRWKPAGQRRIQSYMAESAPWSWYWEQVQIGDPTVFSEEPIEVSETSRLMRQLSTGARLHLLQAHEWGYGYGHLSSLTDYEVRAWGFYAPDSTEEILRSGLVVWVGTPDDLFEFLGKEVLMGVCDRAGVRYEKSWSRQTVLKVLAATAPMKFASFLREWQKVAPAAEHSAALEDMLAIAERRRKAFEMFDTFVRGNY